VNPSRVLSVSTGYQASYDHAYHGSGGTFTTILLLGYLLPCLPSKRFSWAPTLVHLSMVFKKLLVNVLMELALSRKLLENVSELYAIIGRMPLEFVELAVFAFILNFKHFLSERFLNIPSFFCYRHELSKRLVPLGVV
jgi:hypothetical protein